MKTPGLLDWGPWSDHSVSLLTSVKTLSPVRVQNRGFGWETRFNSSHPVINVDGSLSWLYSIPLCECASLSGLF